MPATIHRERARAALVRASAIFALSMLLSGCARYGWASRPVEGVSERAPVRLAVETVSAPAERGIELQAATLTLVSELERCGARAEWGDMREVDARVMCEALSATTSGFGDALVATVRIECVLRSPDATRELGRVRAAGERMSHAADAGARASSARALETEAAAAAVRDAACPLVEAARGHLFSDTRSEETARGKKATE